jgi:DNA mismatch endonuclease (patch repair protein)
MVKKIDTRTAEEKRSYTMSCIRGKATSIEVALQKALWHRGIRYRKNYRKIPGAPDIAITRYKIAVFCDGGFWHGKDWDQTKRRLKRNRDYWIKKIEGNMERDKRFTDELQKQGWYVLRCWGNEIESDVDGCVDEILRAIDLVQDEAGSGYIDFSYNREPLMVAENIDADYSVD